MAGTEGGDSKQLEEVLLAEEGEEVGEGGDVDKGPPKDEDTVFFKDDIRRIDFILVYQISEEDDEKTERRDMYLRNLGELYGVEFELQDQTEYHDGKTCFLKVHCPWEPLLKGAERIGLRLPISDQTLHSTRVWHAFVFEKCLCMKDPLLPNIPEEFQTARSLTAPFKFEKRHLFAGCTEEKASSFITPAQRSAIVWDMLQRTPYDIKEGCYGVEQLIHKGSFVAAYPLHDGRHDPGKGQEITTERQLLYRRWARWNNWYKNQPLDQIRNYFGEKIALYFAWVGHYTTWLIVASIIGMCVQVYGLSTLFLDQNPVAADTCNEPRAKYNFSNNQIGKPDNLTFYMCPTCDVQCDFTYFQDECLSMRFVSLFDNAGTIFFAAVMAIWAVLFLEFWKRKEFLLQHRWGMLGYEAAEERPRILFQRTVTARMERSRKESDRAKYLRPNPVDPEKKDLVLPQSELIAKMIIAFSGLLFMVIIVIGIVLSVILYQIAVSAVVYIWLSRLGASSVASIGSIVASSTGSVVQLVFILIMGGIYNKLAIILTNWELHRTQTEHEDSLITKTYIFQFVNYYSSLFYIAFFKGSILGYPGNFIRIGPLRSSGCSSYGCFLDLAIQLVVILAGKQLYGQALELTVPVAKRILKQYRHKKAEEGEGSVYASWERDYDLDEVPDTGFLGEYLELVIQYGFVTLFVAVFPLAPLLALLNNWLEIRVDAYKYVVTTRRAVAERAQDIGAWYSILELVAKLAIVTNAFLIACTSDVIPQLVYAYNTNYVETCAQHDWPSCHVARIFKQEAGYLNTAVQQFSVKNMFDEERGFPVNQTSPPSDSPVPDVELYTLKAYYPNETKAEFLFMPYVDVECLSGLIGSTLGYKDLTESLAKNSTIRGYIPNCITDESITCGFRGYGRNNNGNYPIEYWMNWTAKLAFVVVFEHVIFIIVGVIAWLIPDVPEKVKLEIMKEILLASEAQLERKEVEEEEEEAGQEGTGEVEKKEPPEEESPL